MHRTFYNRRARCRVRSLEQLETRRLLAGDTTLAVEEPSAEVSSGALPAYHDAFMAKHAGRDGVRVTDSGHFYYVDSHLAKTLGPKAAEGEGEGEGEAQTGDSGDKVPLDAIPALHSDPSAPNTFFLDFDGHVVSNTAWNTSDNNGQDIHAIPFDLDGDLTTFSPDEIAAIEEIWQRVREDFLPFNINVTTVEPEPEALRRGRGAMRAIISTNVDDEAMGGTGKVWFGGAGGVAYVGSWLTSGDMPVWVFQNMLPNTAKAVAEAVSHEFGHALGLSHDGGPGAAYYNGHGTGEVGWAPIMGAGYSKNVTQWSRGSYPGATNQENDLDIITNAFNRIEFREDDHGDWEPDATPLERVGNLVFGAGIIEENNDLDFFSFEHPGGPLDIFVEPAAVGPNLDVIAGIFNEDHQEVVIVEPWDTLSARVELELPADTYYLLVEGGRYLAESGPGFDDYGSLGEYTISGVLGELKLTAHAGGGGCACGTCPTCSPSYVMQEGGSLELDGSQSLGPITPLEFHWDVDGDGEFDDAAGEQVSLEWNELGQLEQPLIDDGTYEVGLRVTDPEGNIDEQVVPLLVENVPPVVVLQPLAEVIYAGHPLPLAVEVVDIAADAVEVRWEFGDGTSPVVDSLSTVEHTYDAPGTYELVIRATDDEGGSAEVRQSVTVREDMPRILDSSIPSEEPVVAPTFVRFAFSHDVSQSLDPADLYLFDHDQNVVVNPSDPEVLWMPATQSAEFSLRGVPPGTYSIVLNGSGVTTVAGVPLDGDGDGLAGGNWTRVVDVARAGDVNLDNRVDFEDFLIFADQFGTPGAVWGNGDFDGDGTVAFADFLLLADAFGSYSSNDP